MEFGDFLLGKHHNGAIPLFLRIVFVMLVGVMVSGSGLGISVLTLAHSSL